MVGLFFGFFLDVPISCFQHLPTLHSHTFWMDWGAVGEGGRWERDLTLLWSVSCAEFTERETASEKVWQEKAIHSPEEHRGRDKDACRGVSLLIKIDFLPLNPAGLHQVNSSSERLWAQSCCGALSTFLFPFFYSAFFPSGRRMTSFFVCYLTVSFVPHRNQRRRLEERWRRVETRGMQHKGVCRKQEGVGETQAGIWMDGQKSRKVANGCERRGWRDELASSGGPSQTPAALQMNLLKEGKGISSPYLSLLPLLCLMFHSLGYWPPPKSSSLATLTHRIHCI